MQAAALPDGQATRVLSSLTRIAWTEALMVPEILIIILSFATSSTLASAARVSKAWSSIALDRLWLDHDLTVLDLLQVLPVSHMLDVYNPWRIWDLVHDPTEEEWARFCSYASRVCSLVFPAAPGGNPDQIDSRITEWKVEKEVLFPRLRRIKAYIWASHGYPGLPPSQLLQFIAPGLREFYLDTKKPSSGYLPILDVLATSERLHLQKLKLNHSAWPVDIAVADAVANLALANEASIEALELPVSPLNASLITGHSFLNLRALNFDVELLGCGGDKHPIQVLVEGCPHVANLIIRLARVYPATDLFDQPGLRTILNWHLLSLEVLPTAPFRLTKAHLEEMGRAWPNLKKLNLNRNWGHRTPLPFSRLADMVFEFPQLEDLGGLFHYETEDGTHPPTHRLSSEHRRPSRLRKLRLGSYSRPPRSERERVLVARLLARALPPGLRISFGQDTQVNLSPAELAERERAAVPGRELDPKWDISPEWDALFRQIEELQGGARIWVGPILDNSDEVWF